VIRRIGGGHAVAPASRLAETIVPPRHRSPRCQSRGDHAPKEGDRGLHGVENSPGLGESFADLGGKARFGRHLIERVEVASKSSAHLLGRKRLARLEIEGMIVAAQAPPRRLGTLLPGLADLGPPTGLRFRLLGQELCSSNARSRRPRWCKVLAGMFNWPAILRQEVPGTSRALNRAIFSAASRRACRLRLRPIMMTSFAFILGVVPLVIATGAGSEMRHSLGTAVFSGMLGVTLFGVFLTPVFYCVIQWFSDRRLRRRAEPAMGASWPMNWLRLITVRQKARSIGDGNKRRFQCPDCAVNGKNCSPW
jgi:hypothetical protein